MTSMASGRKAGDEQMEQVSKCPDCNSEKIKESFVTEWMPYGRIEKAFQATFPVMECECGFGWRDYRAEDAIDKAMEKFLQPVAEQFSRADEVALSAEADYYEGSEEMREQAKGRGK